MGSQPAPRDRSTSEMPAGGVPTAEIAAGSATTDPGSRPAVGGAETTGERDSADPPVSLFLGEDESATLVALREQEVVRIDKGRGGRSLAFKLRLANGMEAYFKPEQSFSGAHFYSELAAYYLDRELGLGRVPPTVGRRLPWAPLRRAAAGDRRTDEVTVAPDGTVRGALIWWIPERLERLHAGRGWERWVRNGESLMLTPFQRPIHYREDGHLLSSGETAGVGSKREPEDQPSAAFVEPDTAERPLELADLIVFDYLISNVDRWGGNFTNVRTRGAGGPLIFLDNGAGFYPSAHIDLMENRLRALHLLRPSTVEAVRALRVDRLRARMTADPLWPFLDDRHFDNLDARRLTVLEYASSQSTAAPSSAE